MARKPMSSVAELAVHAEQIEQLERSRDNIEESIGGIMRELSSMRTEMAVKLGNISAKLDQSPPISSRAGAKDNYMKMGALISVITALAQVVVELAKAILAAH